MTSNFSENLESEICCVCIYADSPVQPEFIDITENFIKVRSEFFSIRNIIIDELNLINYQFDPGEEESSMKCCKTCQTQIINFFYFQLRVRQAQEEFSLPKRPVRVQKQSSDEPVVWSTLDIVKNFIENHRIKSISQDDEEDRLTIQRIKSAKIIKAELQSSFLEDPEPEVTENEKFDLKGEAELDETEDFVALEEVEAEEGFHEDVEMLEVSEETERNSSKQVEFVEKTPDYLIKAFQPPTKSHRPKDPENWIRSRQKAARARGEEYVTLSGKVVPAKRMQSPCKESCRYKCQTKISEEDRRKNFENYWKLASFILQRKFIFEHHKTVPVQRRRIRAAGGKPREYSSQFYLDFYGEDGKIEGQVHVCEKMFLKTLDICRNIVTHLHKKVLTGTVQDLRGTAKWKLTAGHEVAIEQIKLNEEQIPITKLFEIYQKDCVDRGITPVKSHTFRKLFSEYREGNFFKQRDSCEENAKQDLKISHENHEEKHENDVLNSQKFSEEIKVQENSLQDDDIVIEEHLSFENDEQDYS